MAEVGTRKKNVRRARNKETHSIGVFYKKNHFHLLMLKIMLVCNKIKSVSPGKKRQRERKKFSAVY